jgi:hypothetical protein
MQSFQILKMANMSLARTLMLLHMMIKVLACKSKITYIASVWPWTTLCMSKIKNEHISKIKWYEFIEVFAIFSGF